MKLRYRYFNKIRKKVKEKVVKVKIFGKTEFKISVKEKFFDV
jgi:uncharacterized protein YnzC (UPF0291/DUF896 family)